MINRRQLIQSLIATTVAGATSSSLIAKASTTTPTSSAATVKPKGIAWKNWSGNLECYPQNRKAPQSIEALQDLIKSSAKGLRPVGAGHSFSALVPTDETILSTRAFSGLIEVNKSAKQATIAGGTILSELGPLLADHQQALYNMPDIDQQTLAGAISTATHGTGKELGSLSSYVRELAIITADGVHRTCNANQEADLFEAARIGLGSLGVITSVTMQNRTPFNLKRQSEWMTFEDALDQALSAAKNNRNFEFYTIPFTGMVLTDRLNITDDAPSHSDEIDANDAVLDLKLARDYLSWSNRLRKMILGGYMKTIKTSTNVDRSYSIYATERNVRFNEMEYHLPIEAGMTALAEIKTLIEKDFPEVFYPIECRFVRSDDLWLSPFYQRETISIAVHRYFEEDYDALFKAIEPIFQRHGGRPHWGKINTFSHEQFQQAYPKWDAFKAVRAHYDPQGKFLNPYLSRTFGLV